MKGNQGLDALAALCGGQSAPGGPANSMGANGRGADGERSQGMAAAPGSHPAPATQNTNQSTQQQAAFQNNVTQQQWQNAIVAALGGNGGSSPAMTAQQALALLAASGVQQQNQQQQQQQQQQHLSSSGAPTLAAMKQLAYLQYIQAQAQANAAAQAQASAAAQQAAQIAREKEAASLPFVDSNQAAIARAIAEAQKLVQKQDPSQGLGNSNISSNQQVIPSPAIVSKETAESLKLAQQAAAKTNPMSPAAALNAMKPPPPPSQGGGSIPSTLSTSVINLGSAGPSRHATIAPQPATHPVENAADVFLEDKRQQKRAANRKSAQLSRKRKKQFIEELKEENDELRRKEQILRSIPDLIVVFDSSGKLWFVSQSVSRFLSMTAEELEGSSFWDRLCDDSVRLLKAAFMDSLAARKSHSTTVPLGSGIWELRLVDKDGSHKIITLNGVVHFTGDAPECVCSIRPRDDAEQLEKTNKKEEAPVEKKEGESETKADPSAAKPQAKRVKLDPATTQPQIRIKPHQSVISNGSSDDASVRIARGKAQKVKGSGSANGGRREAARISDGDSGSFVSESGSDE